MIRERSGSRRVAGLALTFAGAVCFSLLGVVVKAAFEVGGSVYGLMAVRFLIAGVATLSVVGPRRVGTILRQREGLWLAAAGLIAGAIVAAAETAALRVTTVAVVVLILWTAPVWIGFVEWLHGERRPTVPDVLALACLGTGLYLLLGSTALEFSFVGIVLAFVASIGTAFLFLVSRTCARAYGSVASVAVFSLSAAAAAVPLALLSTDLLAHVVTSPLVLYGVLLGVVPTLGGLILLFEGLRWAGPFEASVVAAVEPLFAAALAWVVHDEVLGRVQLIGGVLVIASSVMIGVVGARHADTL